MKKPIQTDHMELWLITWAVLYLLIEGFKRWNKDDKQKQTRHHGWLKENQNSPI